MAAPATPPLPDEGAEYFRQKQLRPAFDHRDVWQQEHRHAHTVAKVTELEMLSEIQASLQANLDNGGTFQQWVKSIRPDLQKRGWWGKRSVTDPETGEIRETEIGAPHRLRTIYDTNMRQARAAGQWARIERTRDELPYLIYELGPSIEHRPEHVSWAGTLLPVGHDWWLSHMPMNGWGCKCGVRQVGRVEYQRLLRDGVRVQGPMEFDGTTGLPTGRRLDKTIPAKTEAPPLRLRQWKNKRTGQVEWVPTGIDPGFDYNPGVQRSQVVGRVVTDKAKTLPPEMGRRLEDVVGPTPAPAAAPAPAASPASAPAPSAAPAAATRPAAAAPAPTEAPRQAVPAVVDQPAPSVEPAAPPPAIEVPAPVRGPLDDFVRAAIEPAPVKQPPLVLGQVDRAAADRWPVSIEGRQVALDHDYTRHILRRHGGEAESARGQIPLTAELLFGALLVASAESAELVEGDPPKARNGSMLFEATAVVGGFRYTVVWERRRKFIVPYTMHVRTAK